MMRLNKHTLYHTHLYFYPANGTGFVPTTIGLFNYSDVKMCTMAAQITSLTIIYSTVYSGVDQRKHHSSALLAFVRGIHREPVNSPHKGPVTRKKFPFDDVIMSCLLATPRECVLIDLKKVSW